MPTSFFGALLAILEGNHALSSSVPGGFWHRQIPPGRPAPAVEYMIPTSLDTRISKFKYLQDGKLRFVTYARNPAQADAIADEIGDFLAVAAWGLRWRGGHLTYFSRSVEASPGGPTEGYAASWMQSEVRLFDYQLQGAYS